jgi:hypothetical protein
MLLISLENTKLYHIIYFIFLFQFKLISLIFFDNIFDKNQKKFNLIIIMKIIYDDSMMNNSYIKLI